MEFNPGKWQKNVSIVNQYERNTVQKLINLGTLLSPFAFDWIPLFNIIFDLFQWNENLKVETSGFDGQVRLSYMSIPCLDEKKYSMNINNIFSLIIP